MESTRLAQQCAGKPTFSHGPCPLKAGTHQVLEIWRKVLKPSTLNPKILKPSHREPRPFRGGVYAQWPGSAWMEYELTTRRISIKHDNKSTNYHVSNNHTSHNDTATQIACFVGYIVALQLAPHSFGSYRALSRIICGSGGIKQSQNDV